eukprot:363236-Chlamydomonas_euryale.AAC.6
MSPASLPVLTSPACMPCRGGTLVQGTFVCAGCNSKVFDSTAKYESGAWRVLSSAFASRVEEPPMAMHRASATVEPLHLDAGLTRRSPLHTPAHRVGVARTGPHLPHLCLLGVA